MKSLKTKILLLLTIGLVSVTGLTPIAQADIWSALGTNDANGDGKVNEADFLLGGDKNKVVSFTDFRGELAPPSTEGYAPGLTQATDARSFILNVVNFFLGFLGLIAVVIIIYGGFLYVTDAGKGDGSKKGKQAISGALIGIIIILSSFAIVNTILLAPSDNEKGTVGGSGSPIRGVAGREGINYTVRTLQEVIEDMANNYRFYLMANNQFNLVKTNLNNTLNVQVKSCVLPNFISCNNLLADTVDKEIASLGNLLNNSYATPEFQRELSTLINERRSTWVINIRDYEKTIREKGCYQLNTAGQNNCTEDPDQKDIRDYWNSALGPASEIQKELNRFIATTGASGETVIKTAYNERLYIYFQRLNTIRTAVNSVGVASDAFNALFSDYNAAPNNGNDIVYASLPPSAKSTDFPATSNLVTYLQSLQEIYSIISNLKYVYAALDADITEGNAPLIVNFSTVGSKDPSGQSIENDEIEWTFPVETCSGLTVAQEETPNPKDAPVTYTAKGPTASCTFDQAGTYRVSVKVPASEKLNPATNVKFSEEIAAGISYIDIKVNPPATKINLTTKTSAGAAETTVLKYDDEGMIETERSVVYYTLDEASAGIVFDATKTKSANNKDDFVKEENAKIKWNFGVENTDNDALLDVSNNNLQKTVKYTKNGSYRIKLEVYNKNNIVDRKIFTLVVADVAPRIGSQPQTGRGGEEIIFDGSESSPTNSTKNWKVVDINKKGSEAVQYDSTDNVKRDVCKKDSGGDELECVFKAPGTYRVDLNVGDGNEAALNDSKIIQITSQKPIAGFKLINNKENLPSTFLLQSSKLTFDPDDTTPPTVLEYQWDIDTENCVLIEANLNGDQIPDALKTSQTNCSELSRFSTETSNPLIKFTQPGNYTIKLVVREQKDQNSISEPFETAVEVTSVLSLYWGNMKPVSILQSANSATNDTDDEGETTTSSGPDQPQAKVDFLFSSPEASSYEIDFGDGETATGEYNPTVDRDGDTGTDTQIVSHAYKSVGKFKSTVTVFDKDDVENSLTRTITIGNAEAPIPIITVKKNNVEVLPTEATDLNGKKIENVIPVNRKDTLIFDAEKSVNTDGTGRRLTYAWNINNGEKQAVSRTVSHNFKSLSDEGKPYTVKLTATNERDVTQKAEDTVNILVVSLPPEARSLNAIPVDAKNLVTPVNLDVSLVNPNDPDGQITQYKWWYSKVDQSGNIIDDERRGLQITKSPQARLTLGTSGESGEKVRYKIGAEMTDNDNVIASTDAPRNSPRYLDIPQPVIEVVNGPNKAPIAKFSVDRTTISAGETVSFTSSSSDPDAGDKITNYVWDFGDGSATVTGANKANVQHKYQQGNAEGYRVRLRVTDSNGSESSSEPVKIVVQSVAKPPVAAFTSQQDGSGTNVRFTNTSRADQQAGAKIVKYVWDFDISNDADGDGVNDNDIQSTSESPSFNYTEYKIYRARLTVTDDQGQSKSVNNFVNVKAPAPTPAPAPANPTTPATGNRVTMDNSTLSKTLAANLFNASNHVDLALLIASVAAYVILFVVSNKASRKKKNSLEND